MFILRSYQIKKLSLLESITLRKLKFHLLHNYTLPIQNRYFSRVVPTSNTKRVTRRERYEWFLTHQPTESNIATTNVNEENGIPKQQQVSQGNVES